MKSFCTPRAKAVAAPGEDMAMAWLLASRSSRNFQQVDGVIAHQLLRIDAQLGTEIVQADHVAGQVPLLEQGFDAPVGAAFLVRKQELGLGVGFQQERHRHEDFLENRRIVEDVRPENQINGTQLEDLVQEQAPREADDFNVLARTETVQPAAPLDVLQRLREGRAIAERYVGATLGRKNPRQSGARTQLQHPLVDQRQSTFPQEPRQNRCRWPGVERISR